MALLDDLQGQVTRLTSSRAYGRVNDAVNAAQAGLSAYSRSYGSGAGGKPGPVNPLEAAMGRPDPLMAYDWYCLMPTLSGIGADPTSLPWDRVEEATLPQVEFEPVSNYRAGKTYHYPSHHNLSTLTCKLYEDANGSATAYIRNWQSLIMDRQTGLYNPAAVFKLPITFALFDVAREDVATITYIGCWPQTTDSYGLESGQSNRINPSVTFSVDDVVMSFAKFTATDLSSAGFSGKDYPPQVSTNQSVFPTPSLGIFDR